MHKNIEIYEYGPFYNYLFEILGKEKFNFTYCCEKSSENSNHPIIIDTNTNEVVNLHESRLNKIIEVNFELIHKICENYKILGFDLLELYLNNEENFEISLISRFPKKLSKNLNDNIEYEMTRNEFKVKSNNQIFKRKENYELIHHKINIEGIY